MNQHVGGLTPARTLVMSNTLYPFKGSVMSFPATSANPLRRVQQNANREPLVDSRAREAPRRYCRDIETGIIVQKFGVKMVRAEVGAELAPPKLPRILDEPRPSRPHFGKADEVSSPRTHLTVRKPRLFEHGATRQLQLGFHTFLEAIYPAGDFILRERSTILSQTASSFPDIGSCARSREATL